MTYFVSIAHMGQYFKKKRAIANGIALSGVGIGNLVLPPIFRLLLDTYGLQGTLLVMSSLSLNVCVAGALLRPVSAYDKKTIARKDCKDLQGKGTETEDSIISTRNGNLFQNCSRFIKSTCRVYTLLEWSLLKKYSFVLYGISMLFYVAGYPAYFVSIPAYAKQLGYTKVEAAYLVSALGLAELVGRLCVGFLADFQFLSTRLLMTILGALGTVFAILTSFITGLVPLGLISFLFTATVGSMIALNPVLLAESLGVCRLPSAMGILGIFMGFGSIAGLPLSGW